MTLKRDSLRFIDLFCGIGGFRIAAEEAALERGINVQCVFSSDIDPDAQATYFANFGDRPHGDITTVHEKEVPDHDLLLAGFPCQAFSICGNMRGFEDIRGTLFWDIARILKEKKPLAFVLENVKMLQNHDKGKTFTVICKTLNDLGYKLHYKILNAIDFGLPQTRERIFIIGTRLDRHIDLPIGNKSMKPLSEVLERDVPANYYASKMIQENRQRLYQVSHDEPMIWHENKSGNISAYPYSCAMRAGASYNYLLVDGKRRLTEREMLRLQGFPESYKIVGTYSVLRKQTGNSLPIPCAKAMVSALFKSLVDSDWNYKNDDANLKKVPK
jgi:DNA (cytosine-5)-methyltransferase 1